MGEDRGAYHDDTNALRAKCKGHPHADRGGFLSRISHEEEQRKNTPAQALGRS